MAHHQLIQFIFIPTFRIFFENFDENSFDIVELPLGMSSKS